MQQLGGGESAPVRGKPFFVRCDYFTIERNDGGDVKSYTSGLTLLDSAGDTLARKAVGVNHPLGYRGVKFYQSSYRSDPGSIDSIELVVRGPLIGPVGKKIVLRPGAADTVQGTDVVATAGTFIPDFMYDRASKSAVSRSMEPNNPAISVTLTRGGDTLFSRWVFQKSGGMRHDDAYGVSFLSYATRQSTGLLIKENPGAGAIWAGIIGMSIGVLLVFWTPRRRYWAAIAPSASGGAEVGFGGAAGRDDPGEAERFDADAKALAAWLDG
jgi:cytochrome c biogenesis protein ResB